jgi:uncharacterized repeat protein (TIGR02543 family)
MSNPTQSLARIGFVLKLNVIASLAIVTWNLWAAPATALFRDDFSGGIPGWRAVQPAGGAYLDGPMLWEYDASSKSFTEQSNLYTDSSTFSGSRIPSLLINDSPCPTNFTYSARLTAGDDDAFGLVWGVEGELTFYRVYFARQNRALTGWPFQGWGVDRLENGLITDLFGPANASFINTAGQPFDVTITVTNGLLTLTVVDNPLGTSVVYSLVSDEPLPTVPANARVGIFSWGQSGGNPRSFRVQDPVLTPAPLAGDPAKMVLTNWSFPVTPREDGINSITSGGAEPIWAQGLGINGDRGVLFQNSDSYNASDNVANGTTNFVAPTAVAGDINWSNYIVSARFVSADNDGFGFVIRYQNETNFYRLAFRNQNSQAGIRRGLSVQKNINRTFDQVYSNGVAGFIPPVNVPFEVYAAIRSNRLQIIAINNPDGIPLSNRTSGGTAIPSVTASGPIDFDASTLVSGSLDHGQVGIISWAQYGDNNLPNSTAADDGTAVDWIQVNQVNGEALIVSSPFGTPNPPVGVNDFPSGQIVAAAVEPIVDVAPGERQLSTGWAGVGSVPALGTTNQVQFTLTNLSSLTWLWVVQYRLNTSSGIGGTVAATSGPWINANSNVTVTATALPGYVFTGWSGDSISTRSNFTFQMLRPMALTANFATDSDNEGLPDSWEQLYFGNLTQMGTEDPDGDGSSNLVEFQRGTNPTFVEPLLVSDGLSSQWTNTQRDPALAGEVTVVDFGTGYRGAFGNNNEFRYANDYAFIPNTNGADFASFQSQHLMVRSDLWMDSWATNFSASCEFSVGDNDGVCFYFRYSNESNYYRVTLCGEDPLGAVARPPLGLSVQRRINGFYSGLTTDFVSGPLFAAYADPLDGSGSPAGFKKLRVTVNATNATFEIRVAGWNVALSPPDFDPNNELVVSCTDTNLAHGRIGFGFWGEGGFGSSQNEINGIPIPDGAFIDNIVVKSPADGSPVFTETWETAALATNFPAGWENPFRNDSNLAGNWVVNIDGAISQLGNQGPTTTGSANSPKADADGPTLLAPSQNSANYFLEVGFHQFDDDAVGIVYDFQDTNNYSKICFRRETTFDAAVPPGLSVSRKSGGVWTDITAGDPSFLFTPGRPFAVEFAINNGDYNLLARDLDNPAIAGRWHWTAPLASIDNRFGVSTWASQSAHITYARAYSLPSVQVLVPFKITRIQLTNGLVVLEISKSPLTKYSVLRAASLDGPFLPVATNQSAPQYSESAPSGGAFYRLELIP